MTVSLALANIGATDTTNLVGTLQASGGVTQITTPQATYGRLVHGGAAVSANFTFTASPTNVGPVIATLQLEDGPNSLGSVAFTFGTTTFANLAAIIIPDHGPATPYPSTINVSGASGVISKLTVALMGVTHTFPDDIGALLLGPSGRKVILMADTGGGHSISNLTLTFDDSSPNSLPHTTQIVSGTYKPTSFDPTGGSFPSTPAGPPATTLAAFNGTNPNGTWSLYVFDDAPGDSGNIAGGWSLTFSPPPPQLTGNISASTGLFQITVSGQPGLAYVIQASTNLNAWVPLFTNTVPLSGSFTFSDPNTHAFKYQFYRAQRAP